MEGGEGLAPNVENNELQLIKGFFPDNAEIKKDEEGNYLVDAVLKDSPLYEGGQEISLNLTLIEADPHSPEDSSIMMSVNKFFINGQDVKLKGVELCLFGYREANRLKFSESSDCNLFNVMDFGFAAGDGTDIILGGIKTGMNLAIYFHECGHITRQDEDLSFEDFNKALDTYILISQNELNSTLMEKNLTPTQIEDYRKFIYEERRASLKAFDIIDGFSNLLPTDPDLSKLKQAYSAALATHMTIHKGIHPSEVVSVMDLNQDWHY
jgi:hypothetical protein